jgi:hypothetical protein
LRVAGQAAEQIAGEHVVQKQKTERPGHEKGEVDVNLPKKQIAGELVAGYRASDCLNVRCLSVPEC